MNNIVQAPPGKQSEKWQASGIVVAVCRSETHSFSKKMQQSVRMIAGQGVENDAHCGATVQHLSRKAKDPRRPNMRQIHLIHAELLDALQADNFTVFPGDLGENIITRGIALLELPTGTRIFFEGGAVIEITGLRNPCNQIETFMPGLLDKVLDNDDSGRMERKCGVMGIIRVGGIVCPGDTLSVEMPPEPHIRLHRV